MAAFTLPKTLSAALNTSQVNACCPCGKTAEDTFIGKVKEWGLSNYAAWQVVEIYHLCLRNAWRPPIVYQGMYNMLTRDVEKELFPAIRSCGMCFYAYNPLAGGLFTGKYSFHDDPKSGRFTSETFWGNKYRSRFWHKSMFDALDTINSLADKHNSSLLSVAMRWLVHHSKLGQGDAVIIGGSSVQHIESNVDACREGPLPEELVQAIDAAWESSRHICPNYFR